MITRLSLTVEFHHPTLSEVRKILRKFPGAVHVLRGRFSEEGITLRIEVTATEDEQLCLQNQLALDTVTVRQESPDRARAAVAD